MPTASIAYWEQVGINRQAGGKSGEMRYWYPLKIAIRHLPGTLRHADKRCSPPPVEHSSRSRKHILFHTRGAAHGLKHTVAHVRQAVYRESGPNSQYNIGSRGKMRSMQPENLPDQPLDSVAAHRVSGFSVHTDSQPVIAQSVCKKDHGEAVTLQSPAGSVDTLKIPVCLQEMLFRQRF